MYVFAHKIFNRKCLVFSRMLAFYQSHSEQGLIYSPGYWAFYPDCDWCSPVYRHQADSSSEKWSVNRETWQTHLTHTYYYSGKNIKPKVVQTHKYLMAHKSLTLLFCSFVLTVLLSVAVNTTWETTKTFSEYYFPYFLSTAYKVRFKQWLATSLIDVKTGN